VGDRLRALWDFADLDGTERRLGAALAAAPSAEGRAEALTQLARVNGLRGDFAAGERLLADAEALCEGSGLVHARVALERGRLLRSGGDEPAALPRFEQAYATACDGGHWFLAADAAHMAALVAPTPDGCEDWTARGLRLAEEHADAAYWSGPLLNNLGWERFEAGRLEEALDAFERALRARERDEGDAGAVALARYAVGKTLIRLHRAPEAIVPLEHAVTWADGAGAPDGWFHEELAYAYAAAGRSQEARAHALRATPLLERDDASFVPGEERWTRLRALA